ncbi:MAG TPA: FAD-dependent oxidoreductase, partial [Pyrinomonadaceae bacterium]|nr:FAD-dependent oxidoreductase [Pyrinomonadaceae bacterium]
MSAHKSFDVCVVGAGVFGAWSALMLRRAGLSVLLLDAHGPGNNRSSSGGESRIIRMGYGADEIYTRSAIRSLALWQELFEEAGENLFHRTGVLWMAHERDAYCENTLETLQKSGVRHEKLSRAEIEARYPQINPGAVEWGIFEPDSGAVMARRAVQMVVEECIEEGV